MISIWDKFWLPFWNLHLTLRSPVWRLFVNIALQIWLGDWDKDSVLQIDPRRARVLTDIYEEMMVGFPVRLDL